MAIGTGLALAGAAAIGGATSYLGGKAAKKAAKTNANQQIAAAREAYGRIDSATAGYSQADPYAAMGRQHGGAMTGRLAGLMGYADWPGAPAPAGANPAGVMPAGANPAGNPAPVYGKPMVNGGSRSGDPDMAGSIFGAPTNGGALPGDVMGRDLTGTPAAMPGALPGPSVYGAPNGGVMPSGGVMPGADGRTEFLRSTPGYQFAMSEGINELQHSLGHQNALYSGAAMKAIVQHAMGMADQNYDRAIARELQVGDRMGDSARTVLAAQTGNAQLMQAAQSDAANIRQDGSNQQLAGTMGAVKAVTDGAMSIWGPKG